MPESERPGSERLFIAWFGPESASLISRLDWQDEEPRFVGRDETCALRLDATDVSRRHASIARSESGFTVLDLDSRNGTRVNGKRVRSAGLAPGDVLRFGPWVGVLTRGDPTYGTIASGLFGGGVLRDAVAPLERAARSDLPIVLEGETGTGKEVVARAVHEWSGREGAFVAVNCAALPEGLAEAELFGYRRGAFTGADRAAPGFFRSAHGGTLLLDEISDLSLAVQAKLLRVLEQREVQPLGEARPVPVDVRVLVAGQDSLLDAVRDRRFRADLLARLDGLTLRLPPLRDRREDVPPLLAKIWGDLGGAAPALEPDCIESLCVYDWPLNVRELVLLVRRLRVFSADQPSLRAKDLPARIGDQAEGPGASRDQKTQPLDDARPEAKRPDRVELPELIVALRAAQGNVARASALLGITRQRAYRLIEGHALDLEALRR